MPIKWPMVMPRTQLDYIDTAIEDGRRGVDDGKKQELSVDGNGSVHREEKRIWA